jgi:hypothetical protein
MTVFEVIVVKFLNSRLYKQPKNEFWSIFVNYQAELYSRLHFQMPNIGFKEIAIAKCMSENSYLIPLLSNNANPPQ